MTVTVEQIEQVLPQTQCRQCGYGGCKPYAQALIEKETLSVSLCRPGGDAVAGEISQLLGRPKEKVQPWDNTLVARVKIDACIGCQLCQNVCPTEAFLGAAGHVHQVKESDCNGCQLCLSHCPTECLSMQTRQESQAPSASWNKARYEKKLGKKLKAEKNKLFSHKRATSELRKPKILIQQCLDKVFDKEKV